MVNLRRAAARATIAGLAALPLLLAGCNRHDYPQSTFQPRSEFASWLAHLNLVLVIWVVVIFAVVQIALLVAVVRFRAKPGAPPPRPVHGHTALEIAWTIAPALILASVAVPTVLLIFKTQGNPPRQDVLVRVVGHQWWWEFDYPQLGITTADEMHVPVGGTVVCDITSADIIHSFWFPAVAGKRDAVPNRTNRIWFTPDSVGEYPGQCVEFCGMSHANMRAKLFVDTPEAFAAWVANQKLPPAGGGTLPATPESTSATPAAAAGTTGAPVAASTASTAGATSGAPNAGGAGLTALASSGRQIFSQSACIGCHTINGISAGIVGPNLTHFASRTTFAGAIYERTDENLAKWLQNPPGRKPGALMPNLALTPEQITALVAYLQSLK